MLRPGPHVPAPRLAPHADTVGDLFRQRASRSRARPAVYEKVDGAWTPITWGAFYTSAAAVAFGLRETMGLAGGDRVAILGPTRGQWGTYDLGAQLAGLVSFGIYPKQPPEAVRYLLGHSEARVVFVAGNDELETVLAAAASAALPELRAIVPWTRSLFEAHRDADPRLRSPSDFADTRWANERIDASLAAIDPEQPAILVYTSGTTGPPKAAMITHRNILSFLRDTDVIDFYEDDVTLSFLPMAHVAERVLAFYGRLDNGTACAYATNTASVLRELGEVRPTIFGSVPRLYEKAYAQVQREVEQQPEWARRVFDEAAQVAQEMAAYRVRGKTPPRWLRLKWALADRAIFRRVRAAFGGRVRLSITGAAPIAADVLAFFWGAGLPIYEAYGMTEATVVTHANLPGGHTKLGTVGRALPGAETKVADDGEILVRGPYVFAGYFKDDAATAATVVDGWLHTGDIGAVDDDGFLRITDRKKHLIITAGGKNLAPANIEGAIKNRDPLVSHVHAHGDGRPYVSALVAPSPLETLDFGLARRLVDEEQVTRLTEELFADPTSRSAALNEAMARVVGHPEFLARVRQAVRDGNERLARVERVRRFRVLDRDFSQEHGELTPTMKLKRRAIESKYKATFDRIYDEEGFGAEP
ncbi:MAG: long-chain fatty acid--CoA ligase [Myxococcota bacterium]